MAAGSALTGALVVAGAWLAVATLDAGTSGSSDEPAAVNTVASAPPRDDTWTEPISDALAPSLPTLKAVTNGASRMAAGVVLDSSGHILTSAAVVADADIVVVLGPDGTRSTALVLASDLVTDLAVVRTDRLDLNPAPLSLTRRTRVGQYALARSQDGQTSPDGRVVALATSVTGPTGTMLHGVIAFSSPETPPIPGAGVFDDAGEIFGITTAANAVSADRMGHAIPSTLAVEIATQLIEEGAAVHPWLGVQGTDLPPAKAAVLGTPGGASITAVAEDGPAATAGLLVGDTVVSANGQNVSSMADLVMVVREAGTGAAVDLHVVRDGSLLTVSPLLATADPDRP